MTVDEILASGEYTDRRGDYWHLCDCTYPPCNLWHQHHPSVGVGSDQMRLLIERDSHRDECPGLYNCMNHPVPIVWYGRISEEWCVDFGNWHSSLSDAMDAARALAVEP